MIALGITMAIGLILVLFGKKIILRIQDPRLFLLYIKRYKKADRKEFPNPYPIVFTGSSVVKYWRSMEKDLYPLYVLNRGIAGSKINDIVYWVNQLVIQYEPRAVVLYAGSNDLQGNKPKTPEQVFHGFQAFVDSIRDKFPDLPLFYISITPSPGKTRWKNWPVIQETNQLISEYCETVTNLNFVDTTGAFLGPNGEPDQDLFIKDNIHFNEKGYAIWTTILKPKLEVIEYEVTIDRTPRQTISASLYK